MESLGLTMFWDIHYGDFLYNKATFSNEFCDAYKTTDYYYGYDTIGILQFVDKFFILSADSTKGFNISIWKVTNGLTWLWLERF